MPEQIIGRRSDRDAAASLRPWPCLVSAGKSSAIKEFSIDEVLNEVYLHFFGMGVIFRDESNDDN